MRELSLPLVLTLTARNFLRADRFPIFLKNENDTPKSLLINY